MKRQIKKLLIVFLTTIISILLHSLIPMTTTVTQDNQTFLAQKLSPAGVVVLFFLLTYYIIATVFLKYESRLNGSKFKRAFIFGGLIGGIWWVGMIEAVFMLGTDFKGEFLTGMFDFIPIFTLCVLLSAFLVKDKAEIIHKKLSSKSILKDMAVFVLVIAGSRVIGHLCGLGGHYKGNILLSTLWATSFAIIIALNYIFLKNTFICNSPLKSALLFTLIIFGLHYTMFVSFIPAMFTGFFVPITIGLACDLLLVFIASFISAKINFKSI